MCPRTKKAFKIFCVIIMLAVLGVFFYWVKCQLNINLIPNFAWEKPFPFLNALQHRESIGRPKPGVLLATSFDELFAARHWNKLWAREVGLVEADVEAGCFHVHSASAKDWAVYNIDMYKVDQGDVFAFSGEVRTDGQAIGQMSVILYDANRHVINWGFRAQKLKAAAWTHYGQTFKIPAGAKYMRFQLTGSGVGDVYFDDVKIMMHSVAR